MLHKDANLGHLHPAHNWEVADQTARLALSVVAGDVGKLCWQQDNNRLYILTDDSPMTWVQVGGSDYTLPIASAGTLGGVKVGPGLSIDGSGVLSTPGEANTASNLGTGSGIFYQKTGVNLELKSLKAGTNITLTPSTTEILIDAAGGSGIEPITGYKKLKIVQIVGARTIPITADELIVKNVSNVAVILKSVSVSPSLDSSGANGIDTGTFTGADYTWWYLWIIYNGSTVAGLISLSSSAPTMPSGYTYKALVGAFYGYTPSETYEAYPGFVQRDNIVHAASNPLLLPANPASNYLLSTLNHFIPPAAVSVFGFCTHFDTATHIIDLYIGTENPVDETGGGPFNLVLWNSGADRSSKWWDIVIKTAQTLRITKFSTDTTTVIYMYISGWRY